MNDPTDLSAGPSLSRWHLLRGVAAAGAASVLGRLAPGGARAADEPAVTRGRIKQSVCFWCFNSAGEKWDSEKTCQVARGLGCRSVELVDPAEWHVLKKHGLVCAIAPNGMPGAPFVKGFNNPRYHDEVITRTKKAIDGCAEAGFPAVIAFTGYQWRDADDPKSGAISRDEGAENCVKGFKQVVGHA